MLLYFAVGTLVGATALNFFSTLPQIHSLALGFLVTFVSFSLSIWLTKGFARQLVILLFGIIVGFSYAFWCAKHKLAWELPEADQQDHCYRWNRRRDHAYN